MNRPSLGLAVLTAGLLVAFVVNLVVAWHGGSTELSFIILLGLLAAILPARWRKPFDER